MGNEKKALPPEDLQQAQKIMLYITRKVHDICVKNEIKYWLDYGSMLGTIRHGGFIPWDDDMDICMFREDYERFCEIAQKELGDEFFVQNDHSDPTFPYNYCKVRLNGTVWYGGSWAKADLSHYGIWIDIFPIDPAFESPFKRRLQVFIRDLFYAAITYQRLKTPNPQFLKRQVQHLVAILLPFPLAKKLENALITYLNKHEKNSKLCMNLNIGGLRSVCKREIFDTLKLTKFEDTGFYIPEQAAERLKGLYGDYMQLPPPEQRINYHNILKLDFGKYKSL